MPIDLSSSSFPETIAASDKPVLVDFWAEWCGPCKRIAPVLDEISGERDDIVVAKVNVDENPDIARQFDVLGIPTMILFKDGEAVWRTTGARTKAFLDGELDSFV